MSEDYGPYVIKPSEGRTRRECRQLSRVGSMGNAQRNGT